MRLYNRKREKMTLEQFVKKAVTLHESGVLSDEELQNIVTVFTEELEKLLESKERKERK
jgi:hexokinase|tara:strand:+ start:873 stop:1049 length:177 start_codon:yes stop_codon:yes gene_type:complete